MNSWQTPVYWLFIMAFFRMAVDLADNEPTTVQTSARPPPMPQPGFPFSGRREWARKAIEGYARAQEKKWRNWNEAMYEKAE